ncbi:NAD(P)-binding domain-containing protein [Myceligenerans pegani]|uniref:NAD(P)/FAD-dependent oxidoreductase n=1 Tax=Myceligenerans pegani TaxID=2776917 RepID=A0ABR9N221_9MICO|nr:NAD(P)-binding domain-containing protein [Myceligenerans sp. TRM 65318]MBE1877266.1 NAD(P)/FAD-dependent oxidoreductase [Myceligenerans sp. TRM 65318]MBE3019537.1 NAD(P)/FAD-dependent oxidoreductase [Myceligenerans sp. TRM 65318]
MDVYDSVVIGAGQAGLSASYHLKRLGIAHVVLDAEPRAGGAWQHRWDSLTMDDVHGVADLPDGPAPGRSTDRANRAVPAWFGRYETEHGLPVRRPVRVSSVTGRDDLLEVRSDAGTWLARTLVNATGTWTRPFVPHYPGAETFAGEQLHTHDYPGPEHFRGRRVLVVGAGASAVQFLGELGPITDTLWVTRREPVWREDFDGREAVGQVLERVRAGLPPASVVSVTGLALRPQEQAAARLGVYDRRRPMFSRIEPGGVRWDDDARDPDESAYEPVDTILWATGFRPAVTHLAPLHLRSEHGGIPLLPGTADVQTAVTAARDPRVQLVGYGPSASTIGGNRAGRAAALAVRRHLTRELVRLEA